MSNPSVAAKYQVLQISKNGRSFPLQSKVTSFDYYESLLSPNVTATMSFVDSGLVEKGEPSVTYDPEYDPQGRPGTIYNSLPITGSEEITFKISSSLGVLDFSRTPLYVNGASNPDQESNRESVVLSLVSGSAIKNQVTHVKKNYSNHTNNTNIVSSIAKNILEIDNDKLDVDPTSNKYPFIGNNQSPFDVICMLASKSVPVSGSPGFFFYETKDGHKFKAIDELIKQDPVATYFRTDVNRSSVGNNSNDFKILSFTINKNQNLINALKSGVYSNRRVVFNPKTFKYEEINFNLEDLENALGKTKVPRPEDTKYTRVLYSIKDVGALSSKVEESNEGDVNTYQGAVQMRYNLLFTQVVKMQVPCNPNLKAGDVVRCELEIISSGKKVQGDTDPVESGNYMILDLCHHYDTERSFTAMTLVRDTYGKYISKG